MFSCVAQRVSATSDVARCFGRFAGTRGRRWYRHVFRRIRVASFVVRRFSFFVNLALSFVVISLFVFLVLSFSAYASSLSCRVTSCYLLVSSGRYRLSFVVSFCVSVFRKGASLSFGFPSSFVVLRPVRLRSLARSLIAVFVPSSVFVRSVS